MENYSTNLETGINQEIEEALEGYREELNTLKEDVNYTANESTETYPNTDYFGGIKLSKTDVYNNIPGNPKKLERTGKRCGTNPTYENSLVMTRNGDTKRTNHYETYYTDKDVFSNGNPKFPVSNIEWRIRSVLNADRERKGLDKIPANQKVRNYGADGTIRDMNGYIVVAANLNTYPRGTLIMTTLGPGRVYDTGKLATNHIDIFTHWEV